MAKTREQKETIIKDLTERVSKMKGAVLVNYKGISVVQSQDLRNKLREQDAGLAIVKNRLLKIALKENNLDCPDEIFKGPVAIAFGFQDEISPAKIVKKFKKENKILDILGGFFDDKFAEEDMVKKMADVPLREESLAKFVYVINAPVSGFVNVLRGNITGLVNVLNQVKEGK